MAKKRIEINYSAFLKLPTKKNGLFDKSLKQFNERERENENVVDAVFSRLNNSCKENILAKVIVLNNRYSAGLTDNHLSKEKKKEYREKHKDYPVNVLVMAEHIFKMEQNKEFEISGKPDEIIALVNKVRNVGKGYMDAYSFATKYCSWRLPNYDIPIVDSYVKALLYRFNKIEGYTDNFAQDKLNDYKSYCAIYREFVEKNGLEDTRYKDIDKYLWQYAKNVSKKISEKYGAEHELKI